MRTDEIKVITWDRLYKEELLMVKLMEVVPTEQL